MKKHVLLIDEDKKEIKNFTSAMEDISRSYKCTYASSVSQGIEMLRYLEPHIIVADLNQNGADCIALLAAIKKDARHKNVRIFLYCEHLSEDLKEKVQAMGAYTCIVNPDPVRKVADIVRPFVIKDFAA